MAADDDEEGAAYAQERWAQVEEQRGLLQLDWTRVGGGTAARAGTTQNGWGDDYFDDDDLIDDGELARQLGGELDLSSAPVAADSALPSTLSKFVSRCEARVLAWSGGGARGSGTHDGGSSSILGGLAQQRSPPAASFHCLYASHAMAR